VILENPGRVLDLSRLASDSPAFQSMMALIKAGPAALAAARRLVAQYGGDARYTVEIEQITLLAPVSCPAQMRNFSVFPEHIKNASAGMARLAAWDRGDYAAAAAVHPLPDVPDLFRAQPMYYFANRFSVVGPEADVLWPRYSKIMDFELGLGIFIGVGGRDIARAQASAHIFGYTVIIDYSARDTQRVELGGMLGPAKGKSFDTGTAMGPCIVTADELVDPLALQMTARVNGAMWAQGSTAAMLHNFADMIAFVSRDETLFPGEFLGSGGMCNGSGLEHGRFLTHGDVVEAEVQGIGTLRNRVLRQGG
jgi:2-keto-4-pentenoate hydratase/2-oxohepta-3-ene-1,7-dioic acid hydratase in catechol pathway